MSDTWIEARLRAAVGLEEADEILATGYTSVLAKVGADGKMVFRLLNSSGKQIGSFTP
jgi:hypothetical protein